MLPKPEILYAPMALLRNVETGKAGGHCKKLRAFTTVDTFKSTVAKVRVSIKVEQLLSHSYRN